MPLRPMESSVLPPEFKLEEAEGTWEVEKKIPIFERDNQWVPRRGSLDMSYSILGFITRKISEKSRQRIMSEEIYNLRL